MGKLYERLQQIREFLGLSQEKMAQKLEIGTRTYSRYESGERDIPSSVIAKIEALGVFDYNWIFTGSGKMSITEEDRTEEPREVYNDGSCQIEMLHIGTRRETEKEADRKIVLDRVFFKHRPNTERLKILSVEGDGMAPNIREGAYVVIDESKFNRVDDVYAIVLEGQLLVRRLQFLLDGTIKIISDNERYKPEIYNPDDSGISCTVIGRRVLTIQ